MATAHKISKTNLGDTMPRCNIFTVPRTLKLLKQVCVTNQCKTVVHKQIGL